MFAPIVFLWRLLRDTVLEFIDDECPRIAAALAFYGVLALPPLAVILLGVASLLFDRSQLQGNVALQLDATIGPDATKLLQVLLVASEDRTRTGTVAALIGTGTLLFGATGFVVELQHALHVAWELKAQLAPTTTQRWLMRHLLSFVAILALGAVIVLSLMGWVAVGAFSGLLATVLPPWVLKVLIPVLGNALSFAALSFTFAGLYRFLPDSDVRSRDVWVGALATSALVLLGNAAIGRWLGEVSSWSGYGFAGSLAAVSLWLYYLMNVVLLGAELTQVWARMHGRHIGLRNSRP